MTYVRENGKRIFNKNCESREKPKRFLYFILDESVENSYDELKVLPRRIKKKTQFLLIFLQLFLYFFISV